MAEGHFNDIKWTPNKWGGGSYDQVKTPNGKLTLRFEASGDGTRCSWTDGASQRVEERLNAFIAALIQHADHKVRTNALAKIRKREALREQRLAKAQEAKEQRAKRAREEAREQRRKRESDLKQRTLKLGQAAELQALTNAVRQRYQVPSDPTACKASRLMRWLTWVDNQIRELEDAALSTPWKPLNATSPSKQAADKSAQDSLPPHSHATEDYSRFGGYNFWQRKSIFNSMHHR
jgi:vacuolar-type H+-ATPase subunit H